MQKKQKQSAAFVILITMAATLLSGCTTLDNFTSTFFKSGADDASIVRIGVFEPLSGKDKEYGELELQGIELAHELYPEAIGKKVELVYADNKSDVDVAASAAQDMINKKVSVVLGSYGSALSLVGGEFFAKAKIPAITITSTNPLVTSSSDYYFRTCFVESFQGVALAKYTVDQMKTSTAAIFRDADDDYAAAVSQTFSDKMIQLTGDANAISKVVDYKSTQKDFKKQLQEVKDSGARAVLLASKTDDAIEIMKQSKEMGLQLVFLGTDSWESKDFVKKGEAAVEGAVFSTYFDPEAAITQNTEVFLKAYRKNTERMRNRQAKSLLASTLICWRSTPSIRPVLR